MAVALYPELRRIHEQRTEAALAGFLAEQAETLRPDVVQGFAPLEVGRWNRLLAARLFVRGKDTAADVGRTSFALVGRSLRFDPDLMDDWLDEWSDHAASDMNDAVFASVEETLLAEDPVDEFDALFDGLVKVRAGMWAVAVTTTTGNFGAVDGARSGGAESKRWRTTSGNPRESHARLSGESVPLDERFSNGMRFPGDPSGGAEEVANCMCALEFV